VDAIQSPGGFRFLPVDGPFSAGVAAEPGYEIVRVLAPTYTELGEGFRLVESVLQEWSRPMAALCAMELRIPRPLNRAEWEDFNAAYIAQHEAWGMRVNGRLPAARTNVAPEFDPPREPSLHAFCFTVEAQRPRSTFVISGAAEPAGTAGGPQAYWAAIAEAIDDRMSSLGVAWADATEVQFYGPRADHDVFASSELRRFKDLVRPGLRWFFSRPPIDSLHLEIDVRSLARETWALEASARRVQKS
jgi:hypothetical protein